MKVVLNVGDYEVILYHNIFTGSKTLYYNDTVILVTPAVFWETSSKYEFELNNVRYNLETIIYWYGGCDYKITHKEVRSMDCLLLDI